MATVPPSRLLRTATSGLLLVLLGHLGLLLYGGLHGVFTPTAIEYGEPFIVSAAYQAATDGALYGPVDDLPFLHNNYNPLVQRVVGPWLAGSGPSYVPIRTVTLVSVLGILIVLFWLLRRETGSGVAAAVGALLPLTCGFMFPWMCVGRVDAFATLFSVLAFAWAVTHQDAAFRRRAWFLVFAWIAFAAKQSVVSGCGAALLLALVRGRPREAVGLGLLFIVGCGLMAFVAQVSSGGQYWLHAVQYNAQHDRGSLWPEMLPPLEMAQAIGWPLLIAAALLLSRMGNGKATPWICWLVVSFPLAFLLVRKSGSHVHYFLEVVCALSVLVTTVGFQAVRSAWEQRRVGPVVVGMVVLAMATLPGIPWEHRSEWRSGAYFKWQKAKRYRRLGGADDPVPLSVRHLIEGSDRPPLLLAQTATIAIECGRPAIFDIADFARLQEIGLWQAEDRLLPLVLAKHFPVIAVQEFPDGFPDAHLFSIDAIHGLRDALLRAYRPLPERYRDREHERTAVLWVPKTD